MLAPGSAAAYQLTQPQKDEILAQTNNLATVLVYGGTHPEAAQKAVIAVRACLTASFSKGMDNAGANAACGPIAEAYLTPPGANEREVTQHEYDGINLIVESTGRRLHDKLPAPELDAVKFTVVTCAESRLRRAQDTAVVGRACRETILPFEDLPPLASPESPFNDAPAPSTVANNPAS